MSAHTETGTTPADFDERCLHEDETGCTYAAVQVNPAEFFCTKCGWGERFPRCIYVEGEDVVLRRDFYRCPNTGEWVYRWADERLVLAVPDELSSGSSRGGDQ